jgi:methyltransferase family protein
LFGIRSQILISWLVQQLAKLGVGRAYSTRASIMPKVLIGVPTQENAKYAAFYDYWNQIDRFEGTLHMFSRGQSPAKNRNMMIQGALDNDCTHVLFLDDDMIFKPDILKKLIEHDKDVVTGLYPMRNFPHYPVAFDKRFANGFNRHVHLKPEVNGLVEITNCGFGCVLIKTEVFKALKKPWVTLGELEADGWCDDIAFFNKVADAGFKMYCDTSVIVDHMMTIHVGFRRVDDAWQICYDCRGQGNVQFPISYPEADVDLARTIEGWLTDNEINWLGVAGKNHKLIMEIGSFKGKSTRAFADNTQGQVISIDTWNSAIITSDGKFFSRTSDETFADYSKNLKDHLESGKVIAYRMDYRDFQPNGHEPDFIFIDASHEYEDVVHDIEKSLKMKPKIISGHDYDRDLWPGVVKAVNEKFPKVNLIDSIWWVEL